jgi:antitoxin VapB
MSSSQRKPRRGHGVGRRVAEPPPPPYAHEPATARVFQSGNSQAVRLPKDFRFRSKEVQIFRRGRDIVLREKPAKLSELLSSLPELPRDALPDAIPDQPAEPVEAS